MDNKRNRNLEFGHRFQRENDRRILNLVATMIEGT